MCVTLCQSIVCVCGVECVSEPVGWTLCVHVNPCRGKMYVFMLCLATSHPRLLPHQDPIPEEVKPSRGPKVGGTLITISGRSLDTGSKEDVQVTVGGVDCTV